MTKIEFRVVDDPSYIDTIFSEDDFVGFMNEIPVIPKRELDSILERYKLWDFLAQNAIYEPELPEWKPYICD